MNAITKWVFVMVLWLVMGLGFMSAYGQARRKGKSRFEAWMTTEGLLFILSIFIPFLVWLHYSIQR